MAARQAPPPTPAELPASRLAALEVLMMDCDGVLTDGRVIVDERGGQSKIFSTIDGHGLVMLREVGVTLVLVTRDPSPIPRHRAEKLRFHQIHGDVTHKGPRVRQILEGLDCPPERAAYVGDDIPDLSAFTEVGLTFAPGTARPELLAVADAVTAAPGGQGAVREICDAVLTARRGR